MVGGGLEPFTGICLKLQPLGQTWRWEQLRSHRVSHVRVELASLRPPKVSILTDSFHLRSFKDVNTLKAGSIIADVVFYYNSVLQAKKKVKFQVSLIHL